jgi:hypothetical protein
MSAHPYALFPSGYRVTSLGLPNELPVELQYPDLNSGPHENGCPSDYLAASSHMSSEGMHQVQPGSG